MIRDSIELEQNGLQEVAAKMAIAIRTAPKGKGIDVIETLLLTESDKDILGNAMIERGKEQNLPVFVRDGENIIASKALLLVGAKNSVRGVNCGFCGFPTCAECLSHNASCGFCLIDLGIAVGSSVSIASDNRVDNRIMYSVGATAYVLKFFKEDIKFILGIPLSISGKNIFFDRKV